MRPASPPAARLRPRLNIVQDAESTRLTMIHRADNGIDFDVDVPDLFSFQSTWFGGAADFDGDGVTAVPDIIAYLGAWFRV